MRGIKNIGWWIIGIAIVIGILRLAHLIDNTTAALLSTFNIIILGGLAGAKIARMKKQAEEDSSNEP